MCLEYCYRPLLVLELLRYPCFSLFFTSMAFSSIRLLRSSRTGLALIGSESTHSSSVITGSVLGSIISRSKLLMGVGGRQEVSLLEGPVSWLGLGVGLLAQQGKATLCPMLIYHYKEVCLITELEPLGGVERPSNGVGKRQ